MARITRLAASGIPHHFPDDPMQVSGPRLSSPPSRHWPAADFRVDTLVRRW